MGTASIIGNSVCFFGGYSSGAVGYLDELVHPIVMDSLL